MPDDRTKPARLERNLGWIVLLLLLGMILVMLLPFLIVGATRADNVKDLTATARTWLDAGPPAPGVLGGALVLGVIGVFIGPTLFAVGYRLVEGWAALNRELPNAT